MRISLVLMFLMMLPWGVANGQSLPANRLCKKVSAIKHLPRDRSEKGVDKAYDEIIAAGEDVVPCLIGKITDRTILNLPRCPISSVTSVGDLSYFLLVDILKLDFIQLLPSEVQESFKTEGVFAYHEYIEGKGARKELQTKLRKWYAERNKTR